MDLLDRKVFKILYIYIYEIPPPFQPNQLKFNFDSNELSKGELEAREKLLGRAGLSSDIKLFSSFYFDPRE